MLVEDEFLVALDVRMTIEAMGLSVDGPYAALADAQKAFAASGTEGLLCAVLDVQLRDGEVFPLADQLKEAGVPVIFHSGHASPDSLEARYPDAQICGKPSSPDAIRKAITKYRQ